MGQFDVRELGPRNFFDDFAPEFSGDQDVGLVDRDDFAAAAACDLETNPGEARDLVAAVFVQVPGAATSSSLSDATTTSSWRGRRPYRVPCLNS